MSNATASAMQDLSDFEEALLEFDRPDVVDIGRGIPNLVHRYEYYAKITETISHAEAEEKKYRFPPVTCEQFLDDPYYLGGISSPWPVIRAEVIEACSGKYTEAVFTGSIGTGKTTAAILVTAFNLYSVLNLNDPHAEFEMDKSSEISFIMQSITGGTAFTVDYMRLRRTLEGSPWFRENAPHEKDLKASIRFHNSAIVVEPLPGTETAAIGENVMGGMIDEVNHMKVIQGSSRTKDGGNWDQMLENYRAIARRRESRFLREGKILGMLCLVGSANYAGQFTDKKKEERDRQIARTGKTNIYIYDKRPWEVQPEGRFSKERFKVFTGDGTRRPYIIPEGEKIHVEDQPFILEVPTEYYGPFESDLAGAIKDIAGIALHGFSNFISNYALIAEAFGKRKNIFNPDTCNFHGQPAVIPPHDIVNPKEARYVHLDLALSVDYAAFAMGHCSGFKTVDRGGGMIDTLPEITMDALLTIKPTGGSQIPIHKLKKLIFVLREMGYPIKWVSLDGFQSADFIQTMRRKNFRSGLLSLDRTPEPYMLTKRLILDGMVKGPKNELLQKELRELVWVSQNSKVDHPPDGSKDLADAATGVIYGLASKRETWVSHGVDPTKSSIMTKEGV